jgi:hypothetical protein
MIEQSIVNPNVILGGLLGAIAWNFITGISEFIELVARVDRGYAGAAVARGGLAAITWGTKWIQMLTFIVVIAAHRDACRLHPDADGILALPQDVVGARRSILPAGAACQLGVALVFARR